MTAVPLGVLAPAESSEFRGTCITTVRQEKRGVASGQWEISREGDPKPASVGHTGAVARFQDARGPRANTRGRQSAFRHRRAERQTVLCVPSGGAETHTPES